MSELNPFLIAGVLLLVGVSIGITAFLSQRKRAQFAFGILILISGIYVGFAIIAASEASFITRATIIPVVVESLIAISFLLASLAVLDSEHEWLVGAFILIHGMIDLVHLILGTPFIPAWYELACVLYDACVGVGFIWLLTPQNQKTSL